MTYSLVAISYWAMFTNSSSIEKLPATTNTRLAFILEAVPPGNVLLFAVANTQETANEKEEIRIALNQFLRVIRQYTRLDDPFQKPTMHLNQLKAHIASLEYSSHRMHQNFVVCFHLILEDTMDCKYLNACALLRFDIATSTKIRNKIAFTATSVRLKGN